MTGKDLALSGTQADIDPQTGLPIVSIKFKGKGNGLFHEITRREAQRGSQLGRSESFAIVLDNQLYSYPSIDYKQYGDGIDPTGGGAQITGLQGQKEASDLALVLQTGALPVRFVTIERTDVSATLGKDSLRQARERRDRRPDRGRALPARPLPLPRRRRRPRARDLLGPDVRRDPAPRRRRSRFRASPA